jgi:DNA ligase-1
MLAKPLRKPMLATDADIDKIQFPAIVQPKIDGVRGLIQNGRLLGRSGKPFPNRRLQQMFSHEYFEGIDGELACGDPTSKGLCSQTTSVVSSLDHPLTHLIVLHAFDYVKSDTIHLPYHRRYEALKSYLLLQDDPRVQLIPSYTEYSEEGLWATHEKALFMNYEGLILRSPTRQHKAGRSTVNEAGLLRVKMFADSEAIVESVIEGNHNANELGETPHGYAQRSTHAENMLPNGMVGSLMCRTLYDCTTANGTDLLFAAGSRIKVGAGKMSHSERKLFFDNQHLIVGKVIKFQHFPSGVKDKPRFPTFQGFRAKEDM